MEQERRRSDEDVQSLPRPARHRVPRSSPSGACTPPWTAAVLDAYGWRDIPTDCELLLDYEIDEAEWGNRKKPYRYRWSDGVRDEVLARLLELNAARAAEEARSGELAITTRSKTVRSLGRTSSEGSRASRVAEPRPLWGTSDE